MTAEWPCEENNITSVDLISVVQKTKLDYDNGAHQQIQNPGRERFKSREPGSNVFQQADQNFHTESTKKPK